MREARVNPGRSPVNHQTFTPTGVLESPVYLTCTSLWEEGHANYTKNGPSWSAGLNPEPCREATMLTTIINLLTYERGIFQHCVELNLLQCFVKSNVKIIVHHIVYVEFPRITENYKQTVTVNNVAVVESSGHLYCIFSSCFSLPVSFSPERTSAHHFQA